LLSSPLRSLRREVLFSKSGVVCLRRSLFSIRFRWKRRVTFWECRCDALLGKSRSCQV
jgi:hypothetical protein